MSFSHRELCEIGAKWLRSNNYHNCKSILIDCGSFDERPDAIGFRYRRPPFGSVLLEAKVSRQDFLSDRSKPHRQEGRGMGKWRYFICPSDLISPYELPPYWGLLYVSDAGRVKVIKGVFERKKTAFEIKEDYQKYTFPIYDLELEARLLAVNLQGMIYNDEEGLDFKELKKRLDKQNVVAQELELIKSRLDTAKKNEYFYREELEKAKMLLEIKEGEVLTLQQSIAIAQGKLEV